MRRAGTAMATALATLLVGCGGAAGVGTLELPGEGASWRGDWDHPIAERMREIASEMERAGLSVGEVEGHGFLAMGEAKTLALRIPANVCLTLVALASSGVNDLDATLYAPSGDVLAEDVQPDAHPTLQVCGNDDGRRLYYHLHAYEGAGAYLFASFVGGRRSFDVAARIVGGRPGVVADASRGSRHHPELQTLTSGLQERGFELVRDPERLQLAEAQAIRVPLQVRAGHCYTAGAFVLSGIEELALRVLDETGELVASDAVGPRAPAAQFCSDRDGDFAVELRAGRGSGVAQLALYAGAGAEVGGPTGLWLGRRKRGDGSPHSLDEQRERELERAGVLGWRGAQRRARGQLVRAEAVVHSVPLQAGRCTMVLATGGRGTGELGLRVRDASGTLLARRPPTPATARVRLCTERAIKARVHLISRGGSGAYELHTMTKPVPELLPQGASAGDYGPVLDVQEEAERAGWTSQGRVETLRLPAELKLSGPGCQHVAFVAAGPAGEVEARLERGSRLAAVDSGVRARLTACGRQGAAAARVRGRGGTDTAYLLRFAREPLSAER